MVLAEGCVAVKEIAGAGAVLFFAAAVSGGVEGKAAAVVRAVFRLAKSVHQQTAAEQQQKNRQKKLPPQSEGGKVQIAHQKIQSEQGAAQPEEGKSGKQPENAEHQKRRRPDYVPELRVEVQKIGCQHDAAHQ